MLLIRLCVTVLGSTALLFAACGGGDAAPTPAPVAAAISQATSTPESAAAPTPVPTPAPTPTSRPTVTSATATLLPTPSPVSQKATLEVRATDDPPRGVTKILLTVSGIEVHQGGSSDDAGWQAVIPGPVEFDLVQITGVEEILGDQELDPGRYDQVRLSVDKVVVTVEAGNVVDAKVPSERLKIVGGFTLTAGETTILTLDFDADKSVVVTGSSNILVKPVVKLLVRESDSTLAGAEQIGQIEPSFDAPPPTSTLSPDPTPTATPQPTPSPEPVAATSQRLPPHVFVGTVTIGGLVASDGIEVTAWVDGAQVASTQVADATYVLIVDQGSGSFSGKIISFQVAGEDANETGIWLQGGGDELNLTAPGSGSP